ncbi:MAG: 16S rRNA (cytidine(1402)-2'-O)-methyltransferase [Cyanobacteria bacterium P01_F01_bin.150]
MEIQKSTLYIVGTPIGNLDDMTFRAVSVLKQVTVIAAEDTRHTGKLLKHFQITTPQISYHDHNRRRRIPEFLERMASGDSIALVTDAGMPGVSDPGYEVVKACRTKNLAVVPIPGASASITALSASGINTDRFVFEGFLPVKGKERRDRLSALLPEPRTIILYESPHRLRKTLQDLADGLGGDRIIVLARELTKLHEEFWQGTITDAIAHYDTYTPKGEFTLVITGATPSISEWTEAQITLELSDRLQHGASRSQASRQLAQDTGWPRRTIYQLALTLPDPEPMDKPAVDHLPITNGASESTILKT